MKFLIATIQKKEQTNIEEIARKISTFPSVVQKRIGENQALKETMNRILGIDDDD